MLPNNNFVKMSKPELEKQTSALYELDHPDLTMDELDQLLVWESTKLVSPEQSHETENSSEILTSLFSFEKHSEESDLRLGQRKNSEEREGLIAMEE